ncbi:MAG TPA: hypothetical protein VM389_13955 [Phycisphaerae bacterium]|nr:hypothetical protein [Phycisphaerae bacterium]
MSALKGDLINLLWPMGGYRAGSLYGQQARQPNRKAKLDRRLRNLLEHFGHARVLELTAELNASMTVEAGRPPRTFLGHLDILEQLQLQAEQAENSDHDATGHEIGREIAAQAEADRTEAAAAAARFDALPAPDRSALLARARRSSRTLTDRPDDSPILRAAAIALMPDAAAEPLRGGSGAGFQPAAVPPSPSPAPGAHHD